MINRTIVQGRLCHDPELRTTQSGVSVCSFRIAWSEKYKETETTLFLQCTAWRGLGEFVAKYFRKGQEIVVEGKLSTRDWQDKDGNNRNTNELTIDNASFCGPKQTEQTAQNDAELPADMSITDEELPF
jgi:single-strand DNA-binding protein